MQRADKLTKSIPGKEHHDGWDDYIDHPDAVFIEKSAEDVPFLLGLVAQLQQTLDAAVGDMQSMANGIRESADELGACFACAFDDSNTEAMGECPGCSDTE